MRNWHRDFDRTRLTRRYRWWALSRSRPARTCPQVSASPEWGEQEREQEQFDLPHEWYVLLRRADPGLLKWVPARVRLPEVDLATGWMTKVIRETATMRLKGWWDTNGTAASW